MTVCIRVKKLINKNIISYPKVEQYNSEFKYYPREKGLFYYCKNLTLN